MSTTESAAEQNLANGFAAPSEMGDVQAGNPVPNGRGARPSAGPNRFSARTSIKCDSLDG